MPLVLVAAIIVITTRGDISLDLGGSRFGALSPTAPTFGWQGIISLAIPLFLVTLSSQNLPGLVVLRSAGYHPPPRPILVVTGLASLLLAPFGAHSVNLAAITAAICTSTEAHPQPAQRWRVGMLSVPDDHEAAVLTFVTTASGVALLGIGAAFWGLLVGFVALGVRRVGGKRGRV